MRLLFLAVVPFRFLPSIVPFRFVPFYPATTLAVEWCAVSVLSSKQVGVDFRARNKIPLCRSLLAGATEPEKQPTLPNAFSLDAAEIATVSIARKILRR